ncbi:uncharacterized protein LOC118437396 [Folsomia candida]|nr:uncharacterized protein LOC118437396 [Folsomia candida]
MRFEEGKQLIGQIISDFPTGIFPIILDVGCGSGNLSRAMARLIPHDTIFGIDSDLGLVTLSENKNSTPETISYVSQDISQPWDQLAPELTRLAGHVDLILSNITLHWVTDIATACKNFEHLLKPGGVFYFNILGIKTIPISPKLQCLPQKRIVSQITEMVSILYRNELEVRRSELFQNRWLYSGEELYSLIPIMYKMCYNLINESEFLKFDEIEQEKVREEIRNGVHAAYVFDLENVEENYVVASGEQFWFRYDSFTM